VTTLDQKIRDYVCNVNPDDGAPDHAILAVLNLKPPTRDADDDEEEYALLLDGWCTCLDTVTRTIARELGITQETPDG
jgi:hypothetical protein